MEKNNKFREKTREEPVENHRTAAWANIKKLEGKAHIFKPADVDVEQAKEFVDENQK